MTELIELRPLKPVKTRRRSQKKTYKLTTVQSSSDSSSDESSSNDESPVILQLPSKSSKSSKTSKRNNMVQTLPVIINNPPVKQKKNRHHRKHVQQFVINTQSSPSPAPPTSKEIVVKPIIKASLSPEIQYVPVSAPTTSITKIIERNPFAYRTAYTPTLIEEHPYGYYNSYERPIRRVIRRHPSNTRNVHIPRHARKLVNRFLTGMEHAHDHLYYDENDSDHSIDDCRVCRRLRSSMDARRRKSYSEIDLHHGSRVVFETEEPHRHRHSHTKHCKVCNLLEDTDLVISTTDNHSKTHTKKRGKQVHVVESYPSKIKSVETTTTTTTTQPKVVVNSSSTTLPPIPVPPSYNAIPYSTYIDPNTGIAYTYDPNWPYSSNGTGMAYDYSSYYTNPTYIQSTPQLNTINTTVPVVTDSSTSTTQQQQPEQTQTTKTISSNPLVDKGTYTYMQNDRKKHKPINKTVVLHTSRNPTPPTPKIIIEQPRPPRLPRKLKSTTILKERTTQTPHRTTTTYVHT